MGTRAGTPPTAMEERRMVLRWYRREEMNPDNSNPIQYPREIIKKREPTSSCPIFRSFSTVGNMGDRTIRAMKFKKKIPTRKKRGSIWDRREKDSVFICLFFYPQP
jgi:hypothetical protein